MLYVQTYKQGYHATVGKCRNTKQPTINHLPSTSSAAAPQASATHLACPGFSDLQGEPSVVLLMEGPMHGAVQSMTAAAAAGRCCFDKGLQIVHAPPTWARWREGDAGHEVA